MDSTLLGLSVYVCSQGDGPVLTVNGDQGWTKYTRDLRPDLALIDNLTPTTDIFLYTATEVGEYYVYARQVGGLRPTDYVAAWIFVSWHADIKGEELFALWEKVKESVSSSRINGDFLRNLFAKTYPVLSVPRKRIITSGEETAVRYYGRGCSYSLEEIFAGPVAQEYNSSYGKIIMLDKANGSVANSMCADITRFSMATPVVVTPPNEDCGFTPYYNGSIFKQPIWLYPGSKLNVEWRRNGYLAILKAYTVAEHMVWPQIQPNEIMRLVSYWSVIVQDVYKQSLRGYELFIGSQRIEFGKSYPFSEAALKNISVEVRHPDFDTYKNQLDLTKDKPEIRMERREFEYEFVFETEEGNKPSIVVKSTTRIESCPIPGYEFCDGSNGSNKRYLRMSASSVFEDKKNLLIAFLVGCVIGICAFWAVETILNSRAEESKKPPVEIVDDKRNALDFPVWTRKQLEANHDLIGLWDALNNYEFDKVEKISNEIAEKPENLKSVLEAVKKSRDLKISCPGKYCSEGDEDITIQKYIDKITTKPESSSSNAVPSSQKPVTPKAEKQASSPDKNKEPESEKNTGNNDPMRDFKVM